MSVAGAMPESQIEAKREKKATKEVAYATDVCAVFVLLIYSSLTRVVTKTRLEIIYSSFCEFDYFFSAFDDDWSVQLILFLF